MLAGSQSIAPMSRNFRESTLIANPGWTPAVKNVIGLDAVVVVVKNGQQRCKNLSLGTDPNDPKSAQENNLLQLVLGGVGGEGTTPACADPARLQAVVDFTNCFVGLDRVEHFYRPDDRSGTAEVIKQKLKIKRFCNGAAPGPTNLDAADNDPVRYPCVPADDTRAVTACSDPYGSMCTAGTPGCTQGLVVALSEADPNTSDVTVSLSRRVKNDSASVAFAGRQAVKQPQSPTNGTFEPSQATITVQEGIVTGVDFTAALIPMYEISGIITSGGDGLPNINVNVSGAVFTSTITNSLGQFSVQVPNGDYSVAPFDMAYSFNPQSIQVTVQDADAAGVNFTAALTYSISGSAGAMGVTLTLSGDVSATTTSSKGGNYSFTGLSNGSYRITPTPAGYSFNPQYLDVIVSESNVTGQDFTATLVNFTYSISGLAGLSGVTLTLSGDAGATTTSGTKGGNYSFTGLSNGSYRITPTLTAYSFSPQYLDVIVSESGVTGQDFTATPQ